MRNNQENEKLFRAVGNAGLELVSAEPVTDIEFMYRKYEDLKFISYVSVKDSSEKIIGPFPLTINIYGLPIPEPPDYLVSLEDGRKIIVSFAGPMEW